MVDTVQHLPDPPLMKGLVPQLPGDAVGRQLSAPSRIVSTAERFLTRRHTPSLGGPHSMTDQYGETKAQPSRTQPGITLMGIQELPKQSAMTVIGPT